MKTQTTKEISTLDRLRCEARLLGDDESSIRKTGDAFREQVKADLYKVLDAAIAEAWDAMELLGADARGYRRECVTLEICSGMDPYIKGFLLSDRIPAFELRPPQPQGKSNSLSSRIEMHAFSDAVSEIPGKWYGEHPADLTPNVPQTLHIMSRRSVKFSKE